MSPYLRFWTSISVNSMAGAAADTGTLPDSAPQTPLNTLRSVPRGFNLIQNSERRADNIYAPHQFIPRPSAYTRHTITGNT